VVDGTNAWQSIMGSLKGERAQDDNAKWNFQGQDNLQAVQFDMEEIDAEKLPQQSIHHNDSVSAEARHISRETLNERLEAASGISDGSARGEAMAGVATDAAKAGEVEIVKNSLRQINDTTKQNEAAYESVGLLAKHGMRRQALEIAKEIRDQDLRDKALSDLAQ
jgi:hypothetical protein